MIIPVATVSRVPRVARGRSPLATASHRAGKTLVGGGVEKCSGSLPYHCQMARNSASDAIRRAQPTNVERSGILMTQHPPPRRQPLLGVLDQEAREAGDHGDRDDQREERRQVAVAA